MIDKATAAVAPAQKGRSQTTRYALNKMNITNTGSVLPWKPEITYRTGLTARTYGLKDRGVLKEGAYADLCVFDAATVDEAATFARPIQPAKGIETVIVNGAITWQDGKSTGARPGRVLRRH